MRYVVKKEIEVRTKESVNLLPATLGHVSVKISDTLSPDLALARYAMSFVPSAELFQKGVFFTGVGNLNADGEGVATYQTEPDAAPMELQPGTVIGKIRVIELQEGGHIILT